MSLGTAEAQAAVHVEDAFAVTGPFRRLTRYTHWSWFFLALVVVTACNEAEFSGETPQRADDPPVEAEAFALESTCDATVEAPASLSVEVPELFPGQEKPAHTAVYAGSFCPETPKALTVLFITDLSGSMSRYRDQSGQMQAGNDPLVNGTCGRLAAAEALLAKLGGGSSAAVAVRVGMIAFAGDVLSSRTIVPVAASEFASTALDADTFCAHVAQDSSGVDDPSNPGGIDGRGVDASTNYAAAFRAASALLEAEGATNAAARLSAYFVSDGLPTAGGNDPRVAGIAAGKALREAVPSLALNGLLLGSSGAEAKDLLAEVVGDPARVRVAAEAGDLAKEILAFPDPMLSDLTVRLETGAGEGEVSELLEVASFAADAAGAWRFQTQPFALPTADFQIVGEAKEARGLTSATAARVAVKTKARAKGA